MRRNKFTAHHFKIRGFLFILSFLACAHKSVCLPSDHFDGKRFFNEDRTAHVDRGFADVLSYSVNRQIDYTRIDERVEFNPAPYAGLGLRLSL